MRCFKGKILCAFLLLVANFRLNGILSEKDSDELIIAIVANDFKKLQKIINKEKANAKDKHGQPLWQRSTDVRVVRLFLENGSDVNATNGYFQTTALHTVSNIQLARLFIQFGADVNARSLYKQTPLFGVETLALAKLLVENGADVNARDNSGHTPLHVTNNIAIAAFLIDQGADVNAKTDDGSTPLHRVQDVRKIRLLLEKGAIINAQNNKGESVLHLAATEGQIIRVDKIVDGHHASPRLDWTENRKIIKLLIAYGIDLSLKNTKGETAFEVAWDNQIKAMLKNAQEKQQAEKPN